MPQPSASRLARVAIPQMTRGVAAALSASLGLAAVLGAIVAASVGTDADWDLRNYHLYNGFALLHGRIGLDIAPAQLQTYLAPTQDVINAALLMVLNHHPVVHSAVLALPQGLAWFLTWYLARQLLGPNVRAGGWIAACVTAIGATGSAGISTLSLAMSDMTGAGCLIGAVVALVALGDGGGRRFIWPGILGGIAVGLKLTFAPYAVGLASAVVLTTRQGRWRAGVWFALGGVVGAMLTAGWWWAWLWLRFGNPVFPYFNEVFRSPWIAPLPTTDTRYLPKTWLLALAFPLAWGLEASRYAGEITMRDPRVMLGGVAAIVLTGRALWRRAMPERPIAIMLIVWVVSYWLWEARFSIYRYLATLELLTGPLIAAAAAPWLRRLAPRWSIPGIVVCVVATVLFTIYPDWGHAPPGSRAVAVHLPPFPPGTLVILLDSAPMGYVAAFAPASVRFVGAANNLLHPGAPGLLEQAVTRAIRDQRGPLWGLQSTRHGAAGADATLRAYGLARAAGCAPVRSNLDDNAILACPLRRVSG